MNQLEGQQIHNFMSSLLFKILLVVFPIVLYTQLISPLYSGGGSIYQPEKSITDLKDLSLQYDSTIKQAATLVNQADDLKNQYTNLSPEAKANLSVMIPDAVDQIRLLDEVDSIIKEAGFSSNDIGISEIGDKDKAGYAISFTTKGSYSKFKNLLHAFQTSLRLYTVDSISFNAPTVSGDLITFQVRLETYYMK